MVRIIRYLFFFSMLFFMACGKNEFELDFNLADNITENYNVTYYATGKKGGLTIQAVASVREGKCELKCATKEPTLVYVTTRKSQYPLVIYAEKGKNIVIEGDNKEPLSWHVKDNEINEALSDWRTDNIKILDSNKTDSVNSAVRNFVETYPEDPVSTILMQCYYIRYINEREYVELMDCLKGVAKNTYWRKMTGRADYLYSYENYPARLESMILRSVGKTSDTLMIDEKNPVFLLFWQTGEKDKSAVVDSIKKLIKEVPDSGRIIADLCLDIDSMAWKNAIRRDSLDKIKRFWVPTGLADSTMMKFKVNSIPYYIVFEKTGQQAYRGTDLEEAIRQYRELVKSSSKSSK